MEGLSRIALLENQFEAQILAEILAERQIMHRIHSYYDSAYDGLFQGQQGWGVIFADEKYTDEIRGILAGLRSEGQ